MSTATAAMMFGELSQTQQTSFLVLFANELTTVARDTYEFQAPGVADPQRLRAINELLHQVLGHLNAVISNDSRRRSDEALVSVMLEHENKLLAQHAAWAFERATKTVTGAIT